MERQQNKNKCNARTRMFCSLVLPVGALALGIVVLDSSRANAQQRSFQNRAINQQAEPSRRSYNADRSTGARNARRINEIIQGLSPQRGRPDKPKHYRKKIRKIITFRKGRGHVGRPIIVNFNHSVDLSVYFKFNSTKILPAARPVLDDLGYALNSPQLRFARYLIAGHTDSRGARGYNQWLSDERARAVADYLIYNFNIAPDRLVSVGFGEERPVDARRPAAAVNRRVEVSLIENNHSFIPDETIQIRKYIFTPIR